MEASNPVSSSTASESSSDPAEEQPVDEPTKKYENSFASVVSRRQYLNKRTADVFFTFENSSERVPAHKSVLAAASEVFDRMFYGPMAVHGEVSLPGKSAEAFKKFLQFCYLDKVVLNSANITDVMSLLHEYQIKEGLVVCGQFLAENWTVEDICTVYSWAINLELDELQSFCEGKIRTYCEIIFKTDDFLSCSFSMLDRILAFDSLFCDECSVLGACLDWARHKCQQNGKDTNDMNHLREYLIDASRGTNLLYKIRYGSIAHAEFLAHFDAAGGLFKDATEYEDVIRLLLGSKYVKIDKFQTEPRKRLQLCWNDQAIECDLLANPRLDQKEFASKQILNVMTVDDLISLEGFYNVPLFALGTYTDLDIFPAEFSIKKQPMYGQNDSKEIYKERLTFQDDKELYFQLKPQAIVLKPGFEYQFEFCFESPNIRYDRFEIKKKIKVNEHDSIFVRSQGGEDNPFIVKKLKLKSLNKRQTKLPNANHSN